MADKEAVVFIVDVGQPTAQKRHGREKSDLEWAMQYVWDKIATTVATNRKTLTAGVLGVRTDATKHSLSSEAGYENISILKGLGQVLMQDIRDLHENIRPSNTSDGDAISAIVVAMQMIQDFTKHLKYKRKIVLVTTGDGPMDNSDTQSIASRLMELCIELVVLGVDFDDAEYGFKEEDKDAHKAQNEAALKTLCDQCNGVFGTMEQAVVELSIPRVKKVKPVTLYKGKLTLGDRTIYEGALEIDVERYPRTSLAIAPTASRYAVKTGESNESSATVGGADEADGDQQGQTNGLSAVHQSRAYQVKDESAAGGKRDVDRDALARGYEYGSSVVPIEPSDEHVTKLDTVAGMDIVGFVPRGSYEHYMSMSKSHIIIAQRTNDLAAMALSSFIHTLYELDSCAIARLVAKDKKPPILLLLSPNIEADFECLLDVELPFAEDFRQHKFPPLDRIVTISGKVLTEHRNLPSQQLKDAMSDFVDAMDLSAADKEDNEPTEYMKLEDAYSPKLHRLHQVVQHRAVHPDEPVPPLPEILNRFSHPPTHVLDQAGPAIEHLRDAADIKRVPPKTLSRRSQYGSNGSNKKPQPPRSGLDVTALLATRSTTQNARISPTNAIPEFKQLVASAASAAAIHAAVTQLGAIIEAWITQSLGDKEYERVVEALGVMRGECVELEEVGVYNVFLRGLKGKVFDGRLGGERRELWWFVRTRELGLIGKNESEFSEIGEEEVRAFGFPPQKGLPDRGK